MGDVEQELRLLWAIVLNGLLLLAAFRTARAFGESDRVQIWLDTLLLWWGGQYIIVGCLGMLEWLNPAAATVGGAILSIIALAVTRRRAGLPMSPHEADADRSGSFAIRLGAALVVSEIAAVVWRASILPAMSDDALTYHLPAAATWLSEGRISIYQTWFFNPANTFSPLGGSIFAAWLMIPFQGDVAARFMQAPAVLAIFLAGVQLVRRLSGGTNVAVLLALAGAMSAPIVRQIALAKDDLFLTAFVLMVINGLARADRLGPVRLGLSFGLAAAMKVTCVFSLVPLLVLLVPLSPASWGRLSIRRLFGVVAIAAIIAGPWYLRNVVQFGNPLFPAEFRLFGATLFPGLFVTTHSPRLREWGGLQEAFVTGYFSFGVVMGVLASVALFGAGVVAWRRCSRDALVRLCVIGPFIGTVLFIITSPYAEVRFLYPWFLTAIFSIALWPRPLRLPLAAVGLLLAVATSFASELLVELLPIVFAGVAAWLLWRVVTRFSRRVHSGAIVLVACAAVAAVWVNWRSYVLSLPALADVAWEEKYQDLGRAWTFLRNETPPDAPVAYSGTYLTHPLLGARLARRVVHVPVSSTVTSLDKLPKFSMPLSARNMLREVIPAAEKDADEALWYRRMEALNARYLLIKLRPPANAPVPIERRWARRDARFKEVFRSGDVVVYQLN